MSIILLCVVLAGILPSARGIDVDSVTAFGDKLVDTVSKVIENTGEDITAEIIERIREIDTKTSCVKCSILDEIGLPSRLEKLRDIRRYTNSIFDYVKKILVAEDEASRKETEALFKFSFEAYKGDIDKLKDLLMIVDAGIMNSLLDAVVDEIDCSILMFDQFRDVYTDLVSTGLAFHMMNERLSDHDQSADVKTEWIERINVMLNYFENKRHDCILKFPTYAEDDFNAITNGKELFTTLQSRYSDKHVDVMYIPSHWGFYHWTADPLLFKQIGNNSIRTAIFSLRKQYTEHFPTDDLLAVAEGELIDDNVCSKGDTMKHILDIMLRMFKWNSRQLRLLIVVPKDRLSDDSFYRSAHSPGKVGTFRLGECGEYTVVMYDVETTTDPGDIYEALWLTDEMPTTAGTVEGQSSGAGSAKFSLCLHMMLFLSAMLCT